MHAAAEADIRREPSSYFDFINDINFLEERTRSMILAASLFYGAWIYREELVIYGCWIKNQKAKEEKLYGERCGLLKRRQPKVAGVGFGGQGLYQRGV